MTDELKLNKDKDRGAKADALLKSEVFQTSVGSVKKELYDRWLISTDPDQRERIWQAVNLMDKLVDVIVHVSANGRVAQAEIEQLISKPKAA